MKAKDKKQRPQKPTPLPAAASGPPNRCVVLAVALVVSAVAVWAVCEFVVFNRIPSELVGKWVVVGGPQDGATFDFYRSGAMVGKVNLRGSEGVINASIRVDGKTIYATSEHPQTGESDTRMQTIRVLSATQLVVEDEQGVRLNMERAE